MEARAHGALPNNYDRERFINGVGGDDKALKRKLEEPLSDITKELDTVIAQSDVAVADPKGQLCPDADVPDEMEHITDGILPLNLLLIRLAEFSHSKLEELVTMLASKPVPQHAVNGNGSHSTLVEDASPESQEKKRLLLNTIQDLHSRWVKALVITEWARNAEKVGKLIDIRTHLFKKLELYPQVLNDFINLKRDMAWAKVPSPDLKTALHILTHGEVTWMPDFNFLDPPPLTTEETLRWINDMNLALHARLQLEEHDKLPPPFKNYTIDSGRVTFRVRGEFEVDLSISEEDFSEQFWFINFRFDFSPAPAELTPAVRYWMTEKVNNILKTEGLGGCYKYLHEFTLTQKIAELHRQAIALNKGRWANSLRVEKLNRNLGIHYWANRLHSQNLKSWIIIGVHSGEDPQGLEEPKPSYLMVQWFREGVEQFIDIPFSQEKLSIEEILEFVTAKHVGYLLFSLFRKFDGKPRFTQGKKARLELNVWTQKPEDYYLSMQLLDDEDLKIQVNPWMGDFITTPSTGPWNRTLNSLGNPAEEGSKELENFRYIYIISVLKAQGKSHGWSVVRSPISQDELRSIVHSESASSRETFQAAWTRFVDWDPQWYAMRSMSLAGDQWWLVEVTSQRQSISGNRLVFFTKMAPCFSEERLTDGFFNGLRDHSRRLIAEITNLRELYPGITPSQLRKLIDPTRQPPVLPVKASKILGDFGGADAQSIAWLKDPVWLIYRGSACDTRVSDSPQQKRTQPVLDVFEAYLDVTDRRRFQTLNPRLDRDILYNPYTGRFMFRLRAKMGVPVVPLLGIRVRQLQRLLDFLEGLRRVGDQAVPERVTLREIVFSYGATRKRDSTNQPKVRPWRVRLDLTKEEGVGVVLEKGNPHLRVINRLEDLVNSQKFYSLATYLTLSLPLFRAFEQLENAWQTAQENGRGSCFILHLSLDKHTIRFVLPGHQRQISLLIQPHEKEGKLVWEVGRPRHDPELLNENCEFNRVLKERVWTISGSGFKGLVTGAAAEPDEGIERLLVLISDAVLHLSTSQPATAPPQPPQAQPSQQVQQVQQQQVVSQLQPQAQQPRSAMPHASVGQQQPHGAPAPMARFPPQQQQIFQQQRPPQPQPNMHGGQISQPNMHGGPKPQLQGQHGQPGQMVAAPQQQGQRPGTGTAAGMGRSNAPLVVLD
ncbi:uncharacterized protein CTHT_0057660 [Thermochaetoides thermophila DSM 1495]|uniref:Mediator of RNA polymerase II transcription subunit 14 n=1 Tax=Chaetomium thermophilum (strain DSM 1495 / CBS 144.50 / IMI 039719) TaxID=759272 RepID=G0SCL5_CHATD|nr:hypothetical protein CTHT_0057660 [Thermochaetoides thermophila DSM 1495]EGS19141.1 hypothetical protein CTHT_0057660 [Thermochaetoides thermophila DSM 1495]